MQCSGFGASSCRHPGRHAHVVKLPYQSPLKNMSGLGKETARHLVAVRKFSLLKARESSSQPRDWKSSWRDFSEVPGGGGGVGRKFPEGGTDFLEVALVWKFPYGILSKQTSKRFASETTQTSKKSLQSGSMRKLRSAVLERNGDHRGKISVVVLGSFGFYRVFWHLPLAWKVFL